MDSVFIEHLEVIATIGVYDWEQEIKQKLVLDLEMAHDNRSAAASDDIKDALDYKSVSKRIIQFVEESQFQLVEKLAEQVATIVREEFGVPWLKLTLRKNVN